MSTSITILVLPGSMATTITGSVDFFGIANRIASGIARQNSELFQLQLVSMDGEPVKTGNGMMIPVDKSLADIECEGVLFMPAFNIGSKKELSHYLKQWPAVIPWLQANHHSFERIATYCSGSFLLAEAGLLDGRKTTTAWWLLDLFAARFANVELDRESIVVKDDRFTCGAGTTSYYDVMLSLVETYAGKPFARVVAKYMMLDNQRQTQSPYAIYSAGNNDDPVIEKAEQWIRANVAQEFKIEDLAAEVAVSPRTLIRKFKQQLNETPQSFIQKIRIEKCKILLETTRLQFSEIVERCGYNDESAFRRLFKKYCQLSPREYRRRFNSA